MHVLKTRSTCFPYMTLFRSKNSEIEADFDCISTTRGKMAKWMTALDSARQIGLSTSLEGVLIVVGGSSSLDYKKERNRRRFRLYLHNQRRYGKMDGRIGFSASNRSNYILGKCSNCSWGPVIAGLKNQRNWSRFNLYLHNHECYGKMDDGIGFSASDRSIYAPKR